MGVRAPCHGKKELPSSEQSGEGWVGRGAGPSPAEAAGTHVDDGVRLDVVHVRVPQAQLPAIPLGRAHDARGHCVLQGKGAADGHHKLAGTQVCRLAQQQRRELFLGEGGRFSCTPLVGTSARSGQAPGGVALEAAGPSGQASR